MNREDIDINLFKELLLKEKNRIEQELEKIGRKVNQKGDWVVVPEPVDNETTEFDELADKIEDFESNIGVLNVIEEQYQDVLSALKKIEDGSYGYDEKTGEKIDADRLRANPSAKTNL